MTYDRPDLRVIDLAIHHLETCHEYSCVALAMAEDDVHGDYIGIMFSQYCLQYTLWTSKDNGGRLPGWWGEKPSSKYKLKRIAALKSFKQACIDAAKSQT